MTCPGGKHKAGHRDLGHLLHDLGLATVGSSFPEVFSVFWATRHPCSPLAQHPTRCQDIQPWEFPGCPVVRTLPFHCRGHRFDPWWGNQGPASHTAKQTKICQPPSLLKPVVLNQCRFAPKGHLATSRHFWLSQLEGCYWHLVGKGQRCRYTSYNAQPPTRINRPQVSRAPLWRNLALDCELLEG